MNMHALLPLLLLTLASSACTHQLYVGQPLGGAVGAVAITVAPDDAVEVPTESVAEIERAFTDALREGGLRLDPHGSRLTGRIVHFEEGSRALRYLTAGLGTGAGKAIVVIAWELASPEGQVIAKLRTESDVAGGLFGGSMSSSLESAGQELAEYLKAPHPR